jgi:predicted MFS family arabinose efflux permease
VESINRKTTLWMALAAGSSVANLYYSQPLLARMGRAFGVGHAAGYIPTFTLVGLMIGMLLFVPLGDMFERRRLIMASCICAAAAMAAMAIAPNFIWLAAASLLVGTASIVHHLILPFASRIAPSRMRGKVVGIVLSGMLFGTLLARTVSGFMAAELSWRAIYWMAATWMLALAAIVRLALPESVPSDPINYRALLRSLIIIVRDEPQLRESALIGAMLFGALNAFWANLVFFLETPPYHYGEQAVGMFGLIGAVGAASAPLIGRLADRHGARLGMSLSLSASLIAFAGLWLFGDSLMPLIGCVILLDAGVQAGCVSNQARIYSLLPAAPSRANTVYMTFFFAGGALGAALGAYGWEGVQWTGVCIVGLAMLVIAMGIHLGSREQTFRNSDSFPRCDAKPAFAYPPRARIHQRAQG